MSPSLTPSSDGLAARSNTSPSDVHNTHDDALPMITPLHFDSPSALDTSSPMSPWPMLADQAHGLPTSRPSERKSPPVAATTSNIFAVPVSSYGPHGSAFDLSPSPSIHTNRSNDLAALNERPPTYIPFLLTRSRAVRVRKHPSATFLSLRSILGLLDETTDRPGMASSLSVWTLKDLSAPDEVWVVFKSHNDACIFLSLSLPSFAVLPALEADLEPFDNLCRVDVSKFPSLPVIQPETKSHRLRMSISTPDLHNRIYAAHPGIEVQTSLAVQTDKFEISSNPPNPRTTFRAGDWICNSVTCAAHNFGRNLACRGCGCPRSESQASSMNRQALGVPSVRLPMSPRFASTAGTTPLYPAPSIPNSSYYPGVQHGSWHPLAAQTIASAKPASPSHPLLTPSGRSFAVGGRVQNISSDPSVSCIMYWPDNEPFPEQGQIRPNNLSGVPQPPILNTGNRGPIEHQPGDWICQKCNYLNWRRRKVCQTCYPYAEGNGDSISAAVQNERINLLTSLLAQNQSSLRTTPSPIDASRRNTVAQMQHERLPPAITPSSKFSRSQIDLRASTQYPDPQFIYETSGSHGHALPLFPNMRELDDALPINTPAPLLPSFLQDIVQSPTLSPASTSSADLSIEECEDIAPPRFGRERVATRDDSASNLPLGNIWKLNDEETTSIAGIALPHHRNLVASRKSSQEILQRQC